MSYQLYIGYIGEGTTDGRFLPEIIHKTVIDVAFGLKNDISIEEVVSINIKKRTFVETMMEASKKANDDSLSILCIHADADSKSLEEVMENKFQSLFQTLEKQDSKKYCKNIVAVIPITETESWMMADKELLKERINAKSLSNQDLGLEKNPEDYSNPKMVISNAIRIAQQGRTKRHRRDISIADLYESMGQAISIDELRSILSFRTFENNISTALSKLGLS